MENHVIMSVRAGKSLMRKALSSLGVDGSLLSQVRGVRRGVTSADRGLPRSPFPRLLCGLSEGCVCMPGPEPCCLLVRVVCSNSVVHACSPSGGLDRPQPRAVTQVLCAPRLTPRTSLGHLGPGEHPWFAALCTGCRTWLLGEVCPV